MSEDTASASFEIAHFYDVDGALVLVDLSGTAAWVKFDTTWEAYRDV